MKNINIIPIKHYSNAESSKLLIYKENNNKSGIYRWTNLTNNKSYIGSAKDLKDRLRIYYSTGSIKSKLIRSSSAIHNALLKYNYSNFSLDILEYCEPNLLIKREQYYMDLLTPEYNICKTAGSSLGRKHRPETLLKIKAAYKYNPERIANTKLIMQDREWSLESRTKISLKLKGRKLSLETKAKLRLKGGNPVYVTNINNNLKIEYPSIIEAAKNLNVCIKTIHNYANTGKVLKNTYLINKN